MSNTTAKQTVKEIRRAKRAYDAAHGPGSYLYDLGYRFRVVKCGEVYMGLCLMKRTLLHSQPLEGMEDYFHCEFLREAAEDQLGGWALEHHIRARRLAPKPRDDTIKVPQRYP